MLILTMRLEDKVMIGDEIQVQLVGLRGRQAKLGFTAPKHVRVDRLKIWKERRALKPRRKGARS